MLLGCAPAGICSPQRQWRSLTLQAANTNINQHSHGEHLHVNSLPDLTLGHRSRVIIGGLRNIMPSPIMPYTPGFPSRGMHLIETNRLITGHQKLIFKCHLHSAGASLFSPTTAALRLLQRSDALGLGSYCVSLVNTVKVSCQGLPVPRAIYCRQIPL